MKKIGYWLYPVIWMGVIYYSSAQPYQKQDIKPLLANDMNLSFLQPVLQPISFTYHQSVVSIERLGVEGFIEFFIRKGAHLAVFFILCLCFYYAITKSLTITNRIQVMVIAFLATVLYAFLDEWHQGFTQNRTPYIGDVMIDSFGAITAIGFIYVINRKRTSYRYR